MPWAYGLVSAQLSAESPVSPFPVVRLALPDRRKKQNAHEVFKMSPDERGLLSLFSNRRSRPSQN